MALRAGYHGIKKNLYDLVSKYGIFTRTEQDVLGAKNLLPNNVKTHTTNGVTFTVADDHSISLSGTSTGNIDSTTGGLIGNISNLPKGKYKLTGCPSGGSSTTYRLVIVSNTSPAAYTIDTGDGAEFEVTDTVTWANVFIRINTGVNMADKVFKPMIRLAADPDISYVPFAMTNQELTDIAFSNRNVITSADDLNDVTQTGIYSVTTAPANSPEGKSYAALIVKYRNENDITQLLFTTSTMYTRRKSGSPAAWTTWYKYSGTQVTPSNLTSASPETRSEEPELTEDEPIVKKTTTRKATKKTEEV